MPTHSRLVPPSAAFEDALGNWLADKAHGVKHSYAVFQRMRRIYEQEVAAGRITEPIDVRELELRAILHDFGEFIPVMLENGQVMNDKDQQYQRHALIIALIVRRVGRALGITDTQQIAVDLLRHDDYWSRPTASKMKQLRERISISGQLLYDADHTSEENIMDSLSRNRSRSLGDWYFLGDLTVEERAEWKVRTGGLFDGLSAVLTDFSSQDHWFFTETAQAENRRKRENFRTELIKFYTAQYQHGWQVIAQARQNKQEVMVGVRDIPHPTQPVWSFDVDDQQLRQQMVQLMTEPVAGRKADSRFPDRKHFGYSLFVRGEWLDPSILRFKDEVELAAALNAAVDNYEAYFAAQKADH